MPQLKISTQPSLRNRNMFRSCHKLFFTTVGTTRLPFCGFADGANRYNKTIKSTSHHTAFSTGSLRNAISVKKKKLLDNSIQKESLGTALNEEDRANCGTKISIFFFLFVFRWLASGSWQGMNNPGTTKVSQCVQRCIPRSATLVFTTQETASPTLRKKTVSGLFFFSHLGKAAMDRREETENMAHRGCAMKE